MQSQTTTAANKNLGKKLGFMHLVVAAAGQIYVHHPTTNFQQKNNSHNMAMILMQPHNTNTQNTSSCEFLETGSRVLLQ
jgi:hypothetical protein